MSNKKLPATNVFIAVEDNGMIEFVFTKTKEPTSEADIIASFLVPAIDVGRFFLDLRELVQDHPKMLGFEKKQSDR